MTREPQQQFFIPSPREGLELFLRHLPPARTMPGGPRAVLYVHGATFPSALSIAHRLDGRSWQDDLAAAGFHAWGLDFLGYGHSGRYPEMMKPAQEHPAPGRASEASEQIHRAVRFITEQQGISRVSIVAHSWGTIAAGLFATQYPDAVDRLVLFGPVTRRTGPPAAARLPAWRDVTLQQQWDRFIEDVPQGLTSPFDRKHFDEWGPLYLDSDPGSRERSPASVRIPNGPIEDISTAWSGDLAYDPPPHPRTRRDHSRRMGWRGHRRRRPLAIR